MLRCLFQNYLNSPEFMGSASGWDLRWEGGAYFITMLPFDSISYSHPPSIPPGPDPSLPERQFFLYSCFLTFKTTDNESKKCRFGSRSLCGWIRMERCLRNTFPKR